MQLNSYEKNVLNKIQNNSSAILRVFDCRYHLYNACFSVCEKINFQYYAGDRFIEIITDNNARRLAQEVNV